MFATISTRIGPLQQFLAATMQGKLPTFPNTPALARVRDRALLDTIDPAAPERAMIDASDAVLRVVLTGDPVRAGVRPTFFVTGVTMRSVQFNHASSDDQVEFRANLANPAGPMAPRLQHAQSFRVGVAVSCSLDVRIDPVDGTRPAVLVLSMSWMLGIHNDGPLLLGQGPLGSVLPKLITILTPTVPVALVVPPSFPTSSPLCRIAADLVTPLRWVLQSALLEARGFVEGLGALLPNGGRPVADAIFLTGTFGGPITPQEDPQLRYVAQVTERVSNDQAILAWRRMLVDRLEAVIPPDRDILAETEGRLIVEGMLPGVRAGLTEGLSGIAFGIWKGSYFGAPRVYNAATDRRNVDEATQRVALFRGDSDAVMGTWFDDIQEPWRTTVRAMAASRQDTQWLVGAGPAMRRTSGAVVAALALVDERLFGPLRSHFEGISGVVPLPTDTLPPSAPPTLEQIVTAFLTTPNVSLIGRPPSPTWAGLAVTQRDVYDDLRQARLVLKDNNLGSPTRVERAHARQHLRNIFSSCAGFPRPPVVTFPPLGVNPLIPGSLIDTTALDRQLDVINRELQESITSSRLTIPAIEDIGPVAFARKIARRDAGQAHNEVFARSRSPGQSCRAFSAVANSDGPEPLQIQQVDLLRLKEIVDGAAVQLPRGSSIEDRYSREAARGLHAVTFENAPTVSVDTEEDAFVLRIRFSLRLVGIIEHLPIVGEDLLVFSDTTIRVQFVAPSGAVLAPQDPEVARMNPGPGRILRIGISPVLDIPLEEQPTGPFAIAFSILITIILVALAVLSFGLLAIPAVGVVATIGAVGTVVGVVGTAAVLSNFENRVGALGSFLDTLLRSLVGASATPERPAGTNDFIYTVPDFETRRLGPVAARFMINSLQSTINTRGGRVRYTALWPRAAAEAIRGWSLRPVDISPALLTLLPVSTPAIVWNACAMVADARTRRDEARAHTLMGTPVTIDSSIQVTLRASFVPLVVAPIAVLGIAYGDSEFSSLVTRLATVQAGIQTGVDPTTRNINLATTPLPTVAQPVALTLGQTYVVRVTVRATELLDALGEMALRRHAQIAILTNVGRFVVDFASEIARLWQWDPLLRNAWSTDGDRLFDAREMQCTQAQLARQLLVPVTDPGEPFPLISQPVLGDVFPDLLDLYGPLPVGYPAPPIPVPDLGEPMPIVDRPWLFGPTPSPVLRLDPIVDIALRAARPQPVAPSV